MISEKFVHIIPVGFEEDRAIFGLMELGAKEIYLLIDNKKGPWGEEARRHTERVKDRLKSVLFDPAYLHESPFDPTSYKSCEEAIGQILEKERDAKKIFINISTSTKLCAVASALKAIEYDNVFLYYVVPKVYNLPPEGRPFSSGAQRIEVFSPRGFRFGDWEKVILQALDSNTFSSLGELNRAVLPSDVSKASRAKLSYYVRKLERAGYVDFIPGKRLALTSLGRSKVHPPRDDAKVIQNVNDTTHAD